MYKRYIVPGIFLLLALLLFAGSVETRLGRAEWLSKAIFLPFKASVRTFFNLKELRDDNARLRNQLVRQALAQRALLNQLDSLQSNLSGNLVLKDVPFIMAEVVGYSGQFNDRNLIIDKGSAAGVEVESPVITAEGVIGKAIVVNRNNSIILPLTNSQFQLAVMDERTKVQGILQTDLLGATSMNLIKLGSQISIGDTIVTSNLSQLFPKGYPVGKISRIRESKDNLFLSAQIIPFAQVENLEHVFVLKKTRVRKVYRAPQLIVPKDTTEIAIEDTTQSVD